MGVAELVPGVSGGTIAFITGIYLELVATIRGLDHQWMLLVLRGQWREAWLRGNLGFLAVLLAGMGVSVILLAALVQWLFTHHEIYLWSFFFGLIAASVVFVSKSVSPWTTARLLLALLGLTVGMILSQIGGMTPSDSLLLTMAAGAIAVCAWILPGISGSFMLLLLGQYQRVIKALAEFDLAFLAALAAGCGLGLLAFTRLLSWLLQHFFAATLALLCGVMAGSLQRLWPWQQTLSYYLDSDGGAVLLRGRPLSPWDFQELYGDDPMLLGAVLAALAGMAVVVSLDWASRPQR